MGGYAAAYLIPFKPKFRLSQLSSIELSRSNEVCCLDNNEKQYEDFFVRIYRNFDIRYTYIGHSYCISDLSSLAKWVTIAKSV